jgi:hypothetical protein
MKIAILDADPRICGPMTWMRHLAVGFTQLGHEVSVVSSTKSGRARSGWGTAKWGTHWSVFVPEVVKDEALTARLDAADLVILPEPKVPALDKEALKAGTAPVYVDTLQRTKTPFIFALHGNDYDEKSAPFMKDLMVEEWCGTIISHSARSVASNPVIPLSPVIEQPLPYVPRLGTQEAREYTNTVGTTGRFIFNKGPHLVALAAVELSTPATVELWGSASVGLGTNHTFDVYEKLLPKASQYKRYGDQDEKVGQPGWTEHGNTIRPFLWDVRTQNGALV